jgi:Heparinase II/III-like protein/Heparinase II/III N-terminus
VPTPGELLAAYRRLGPLGFARAGARVAGGRVRTPLRRARLDIAPLRASSEEVNSALAPDWRERTLRALPTLARWEPDETILGPVEPLMRHEFDLLGSGPTQLGERIDWRVDFKTGRRWPLEHISRVPVVYADGSDIKVPWELSRCQHLPLLAAAYRITGDQRFLDEIGMQLTTFSEDNPVEFGPCWSCTMDVAIRSANWVATLALLPDADWTAGVLGTLLLHGRFIRSHLEWSEVRGNHYLSDVVGLLPLAAVFPKEGWQAWAAAELVAEMKHQVRADGCDHEMSTSYHRLVTELFDVGTEAARGLGANFPDWYLERLELMHMFVRDYTRPDGLAPLIGDEDSGRFLPLGSYGADPRDHRHLLGEPAAFSARASVAYPRGGYYVMRAGDLYAIVRCGDTGLDGLGGHSHNDQLSFELCAGDQPLVVDPGAFIYTADPAARNLLRSTAFHATLQVDGREQNELGTDYLFRLPDRTRAEALSFKGGAFEGRHHGFEPTEHSRRIELVDRGLVIRDVAEGDGELLEWTFPLMPPCDVSVGTGRVVAAWSRRTLALECDEVEWRVEDGWYSPRYGVRVRAPFVRARRQQGNHRTETHFRLVVEKRAS